MRILAFLCAFLLISAPSALAGGWAVTYVDPVPSIQPSVTHTVGYWVLQHGTHPFSGDLGRTGLRFKSGADSRDFAGVALGEPAHYAVTFSLPAGTYEVFGVQGVFPEHALGTLTVPGTLLVKPVDPQMVQGTVDGPSPWQEIAPPLAVSASPAPAAAVAPSEPSGKPLPVWIAGLVVAGAAGVFLLLRKRLRPNPRR
ncbi:hypothetical protein [Lentzea flaviverrucosa]|uniref:Uncharacterized protein n=1 Tax=Lentzea flaviverrucosa TaxID=200379 RepID=A0A1H9M863_9PSEU|nr:hypothetical protein [Lentzea flaviverrucosa]RDI31041.1 hypothetical protein DFR72_104376 [Lentzea flaviverrucosa]SER19665.1 hypothetical protein SAMN05216195_104251 [Lentzea flaviverrucosa]